MSDVVRFGNLDSVPKSTHAGKKFHKFLFAALGVVDIIGIAGVSVQVLPMNRPNPSTRTFPRMLMLCWLGLALSSFTFAQSAAQNGAGVATPSPTPQAIVVDQSAAATDARVEEIPSGQMPTAVQVEAAGERVADPADVPGAAKPAAIGAASLAPPPAPVVDTPHEPSKYDVTLIGHRNIGSGVNFYSIEREIAVGRDLARQVEESSRLVTDPEITGYVNRIGQNLVRNSDSRVPFTIKVLDNGEVNAFALPGGFFYVDSGLILAADTEAELAAVMAHEIAHVAARHATRNMTKQQIWNMASIPLMFIGGPAAYAIAEVASIAVPLGFLKFSRDAEREADMLGLQYDYAAGYDPQAFVQFFEKLKMEEGKKHSKIAKMFSTHPMNSERITAAQDEIRTYLPDRDSYIVDTSDFDAMKARLMALQGGHRMNTEKAGNRPVLLKRTQSSDAGDAAPSATPNSGTKDSSDDYPTLKKAPATTD
jgi:beta-barrel assembly-enhancing protease